MKNNKHYVEDFHNLKLNLKKGTFVISVSGGVDSMSLLHMLGTDRESSKNRYIVAHFNHGMRPDSKNEENLVKKTVKQLGLPLEVGYGELGPEASESQARRARYEFLRKVQTKHKAKKIITAHHQDDAIETAVLNILRGTGPRGLSSIYDNPSVERPLLGFTKKEILDYASKHEVVWLEDSSNADTKYARNFVRHEVLPGLSQNDKKKLVKAIHTSKQLNQDIKKNIAKLSQFVISGNKINRYEYIMLPSEVSKVLLLQWLFASTADQLNRPEVEKADNFIRVSRKGAKHPLAGGSQLAVDNSGKFIEAILR